MAARLGLLDEADRFQRGLDLGLVLGRKRRELIGWLIKVDPTRSSSVAFQAGLATMAATISDSSFLSFSLIPAGAA